MQTRSSKLTLPLSIGLLGLIIWALGSWNPGLVGEAVANGPSQARDSLHRLHHEHLSLTVSLYGGAFTDLRVPEGTINPFSWGLRPEQMPPNNREGAAFQGHFLCLGRWGAPSAGEIKAGIPHNGEPTNGWWTHIQASPTHLIMEADAPKDGLHILREMRLEIGAPVFHVSETVTNVASLGRVSNLVQHPTLGPPFLDTTTRINTNAGPGFLQSLSYPNPHAYAYEWPTGILDSSKAPLDLRRTDNGANYVSTHVFDEGEPTGWITAYSPTHNLLLGYVWDTDQYPWLNVWQHVKEGQPHAKGLEFGTTGIGRPYEELLKTDTRFLGHNSWEYLDAGEKVHKHYSCFFLEVPPGIKGIQDVRKSAKALVILPQQGEPIQLPVRAFP